MTDIIDLKSTALAARSQERERCEELLAQIERNMHFITDAFFEIGAALTELNNNRLYLALGYRTFAEMLEKRQLLGQTQANKLIVVATLVPREAAVRLGPEKSYALTRYVKAGNPEGGLQKLLDTGRVAGRPLDALTAREVKELARKAGGERVTRTNEALVEARRTARQTQAAWRKRGLSKVRIEPVSARGEVFRITVTAAELARLNAR